MSTPVVIEPHAEHRDKMLAYVDDIRAMIESGEAVSLTAAVGMRESETMFFDVGATSSSERIGKLFVAIAKMATTGWYGETA